MVEFLKDQQLLKRIKHLNVEHQILRMGYNCQDELNPRLML